MALHYQFDCPLLAGLHVRPASCLEEASRKFVSEITLLNQRTGTVANAKSVLSILGAEIRHQDSCVLTVRGADEKEAAAALAAFIENSLPHCDDDLPSLPATVAASQLPLVLRGTALTVFAGTPVVPGIAQGRVVQINGLQISANLPLHGVTDSAAEWRSLEAALQKLVALYDRRLAAAKTKIESELLTAHRALARDLEFHRLLQDAVLHDHRTAAGAIARAESHFSSMLAAGGSAFQRERALDIQDVCFQLLQQIYGDAAGAPAIHLRAESIVVAESLTPGQFLALDRTCLQGLVLALAGATSHTVILARSFGIPTVTGVPGVACTEFSGQEAILDAGAGILLTNLDAGARRYYAMERRRLHDRQARLQQFAARPAATQDGHRLEIGANISSAGEVSFALASGAEGIGLFRTEMLFFDRKSAPDEAEQFESYRHAAEAAGNLPVLVRTLDLGGDKPLYYLNLPCEENPFLGYRAVRIYPEFEALLRAQIRAIVRASAQGQLKLLLPMITTVEEARWTKKIIAEEQARCAAAGEPFNPKMPVGAMLEVPAVAFALDALGRELDFFSLGTNDLLQYFMAADRSNTRVSALYNPLHPSFLRLLQQIITAARAQKTWIGLCGEMGGQKKYLPLLVGLGLDEISVAPPAIPSLKAELAALKLADCQQLLQSALNCATAAEVAKLLEDFTCRREAPLIDPDLIILNCEALTKPEVIKQAADRLYVIGRTDTPRAIEESLWHQQQNNLASPDAALSPIRPLGPISPVGPILSPTIAFLYCQTSAIHSSSLLLLKLATPLHWNSAAPQPVHTVLLFITRETTSTAETTKVLAQLSHHLATEPFRATLCDETDPIALTTCLRQAVPL